MVARPASPEQLAHQHHNESALSHLGPERFEQWILNPAGIQEFRENIHAVLGGQPQPHQVRDRRSDSG